MKASRVLVALAIAVGTVASATVAGAHPDRIELRRALTSALEAGEPGPAPPISPQAKSREIRVLAHENPGGFNSDVVAHKRHAYLGSWGNFTETGEFCPALGVRVYSLFNLRNPQLVSVLGDGAQNPELRWSWTEKVIVRHVNTRSFNGDLAAVSFQDCAPGGFRGIGLYDVSDPANPEELALFETGLFGVHELWLERRGNRAYVHAAAVFEEVAAAFEGLDPDEVNPEYRIIDVTDPGNPVQVGGWSAWQELGESPLDGQGSFPFNLVHSIVVFEKIAYVSYWDFGTVMLDVSNPRVPRFLGRTEFAEHEEGNAHSAWVARGGNILIQTDEDGDPTPGSLFDPPLPTEQGYGYPRIYDISDPSSPVALATFKLPSTTQFPPATVGEFTVHDPKVRGSRLYLSWYSEGVVVLDLSRPADPRFLAQFVPEASADPFGFWGPLLGGDEDSEFPFVWGVFPQRNYVLASDINNGLWVFQVR